MYTDCFLKQCSISRQCLSLHTIEEKEEAGDNQSEIVRDRYQGGTFTRGVSEETGLESMRRRGM